MRRREAPLKRTNPSGKTAWVARWTDKTGKRRFGWPPDIKGTYALKRDAQDAIDACYERDEAGPVRVETVGGYFATWTKQRPRAKVTDKTNETRICAVLDVKIEGAPLRDWPFDQLRRRHAQAIVDHMLREQGRARAGALNILRTLATMAEDAIEDEVCVANPFRGVKIRPNDPRVQKFSRRKRVWSWEQLHAFAAECAVSNPEDHESSDPRVHALVEWRAVYAEPMARVLSDCGLRIGEAFGLRRQDFDAARGLLEVRQSVSLGEVFDGTKTDHGEVDAGRVVPVPPALCAMLLGMPKRIDTTLLFPTPKGHAWWYSDWSRNVWKPACKRLGVDPLPGESRHSFVSLMRAAGIDPADLADVTGHSEATANAHYVHGLGRSFDTIRNAVG